MQNTKLVTSPRTSPTPWQTKADSRKDALQEKRSNVAISGKLGIRMLFYVFSQPLGSQRNGRLSSYFVETKTNNLSSSVHVSGRQGNTGHAVQSRQTKHDGNGKCIWRRHLQFSQAVRRGNCTYHHHLQIREHNTATVYSCIYIYTFFQCIHYLNEQTPLAQTCKSATLAFGAAHYATLRNPGFLQKSEPCPKTSDMRHIETHQTHQTHRSWQSWGGSKTSHD